MHVEILIAGSAGQGIILMGNIIGAAATLQGRYATQVSTYGAAQRHMPVHTEIVISNRPVKFPFIQKPDFFIAMNKQGFNKFNKPINKNTLVFINSDEVDDVRPDWQYILLPASEIAKKLRHPIGANFVMLGRFITTTRMFTLKMVEKAIKENTPEEFVEKNLEALKKGME
jgi:2-oxoglutarate ferredoxin oxidoreductase subunit gamma